MLRLPAALAALVLLAVPASAGAASSPAKPSIVDAPIRTAHVGDQTIGYRSVGRGHPLVMVMGLAGTMDAWAPDFVDGLARHRRVIVFDNPGIRDTSAPYGPMTIDAMADTTANLIRVLNLKRPDVLGWSMGGMIAQSLALRRPVLVRRLVLAGTLPGDGHAKLPDDQVLYAMAHGHAAILPLLFPAGHEDALDAYARAIQSYPDAHPAAAANIVDTQVAATALWLDEGNRVGDLLPGLTTPTLVADGAQDVVLPAANTRHLARTAPNAQLLLYPHSGNGFLFQDRRAVTAAIERFLR